MTRIRNGWRCGAGLWILCCIFCVGQIGLGAESGRPWARHVIDDGSKGADGTKLGDVNGDGLVDIVTGWEEGGAIRVYLNPGKSNVKEKWAAVEVGRVGSPEDAVFVDVDGDGVVDVVSCCEGKTKTVNVHWGPGDRGGAWKTELLPASAGVTQWMFCLPMQVDGKNGVDLVCGAKGAGAEVGWFEAPVNAREVGGWKWHGLRGAGWIMSLVGADMDGDGDLDVLLSDRRGGRRGVYWLENGGGWREHVVGAAGKEAMFLSYADLDGDGMKDVVVAVKPKDLLWLRRLDKSGTKWESHTIRMPEEAGGAKSVGVGDINGDGKMDLVFSCEDAKDRPGVMWLEYRKSPGEGVWAAHDISGAEGIKYDLVELLDLDGDGDLDVLTSEEREFNAVLWYENPGK